MISRYIIILLVTGMTIPAFADNPVKTDCSTNWSIYLEIFCGINNIRDFFVSSLDKQDIIIAQDTQIEKSLIQQNKLQAYNYCIGLIHYTANFQPVDDFITTCVNQTLDKTK